MHAWWRDHSSSPSPNERTGENRNGKAPKTSQRTQSTKIAWGDNSFAIVSSRAVAALVAVLQNLSGHADDLA